MMRHEEARRLLPQLAEGALGGARERRLRRHVDSCADCRSWLDTYGLLVEGLAGPAEGEHPTSDQLARLVVDGSVLGGDELEALDEHLESCPDCRRQVELAGASLAAAGGEDRAVWRHWLVPGVAWRVAAAAGLALAVGLAFEAPRRAPRAIAGPELAASAAADQELAEGVLAGVRVIEVEGSITARQVTVERGAELTLRARGTVVLGDGFSVGDGASLRIENVAAVGGGGNDEDSA